MKQTIKHYALGEIIYEENIWSGKKTICIDGVMLQKVKKDTYSWDHDGQQRQVILRGSVVTGATMTVDGEEIILVPKPAVLDWLLSFLPFAIIMVWGNNTYLCSLIPVAGGAIGGALGGAGLVITMLKVREKRGVKKVLIALLATLITFAVGAVLGFVLALALAMAMAQQG